MTSCNRDDEEVPEGFYDGGNASDDSNGGVPRETQGHRIAHSSRATPTTVPQLTETTAGYERTVVDDTGNRGHDTRIDHAKVLKKQLQVLPPPKGMVSNRSNRSNQSLLTESTSSTHGEGDGGDTVGYTNNDGATSTVSSITFSSASLPVHAVDMLRRTDEAAYIIQQKVRKIWGRPTMVDVVEDVMQQMDDDDERDEECDVLGEDEVEEMAEERDWERLYSLIVVALFSIGMIMYRCISKCFGKNGDGEGDNDLEGGREILDMAQGVGTEGVNPINPFAGPGGGAGGAGGAPPASQPPS